MPEGVKQSYSCISERPFLKYWCHFSAKVGEINLFRILEMSHVCIPENPAAVEAAFKGVTGSAQSDAVYAPLLAKSKLLELISYYIMNLRLDEISYKNLGSARKLTAVLDYIAANIEHNITIHDLAEIALMHPNYLIRLFKQQIGVPPSSTSPGKRLKKPKTSWQPPPVQSATLPTSSASAICSISRGNSRNMPGLRPQNSENRKQEELNYEQRSI